jgi:hypothetical protein
MSDFQVPKITTIGIGLQKEELVDAVDSSAGAADAGKIVLLNSSGVLDPSFGAGGGSGSGNVVGPSSSIDGDLAQYSGTTGKLLKDGGLSIDTDGTLAADSDSKLPTQKAVKAYVDNHTFGQVQSDWNETTTSAPDFIKNKPTIPVVPTLVSAFTNDAGYLTTVGWAAVTGKPTFATVATSGSYLDLSNTPTIPAAQVNSDWTASSGVAQI